MNETTNETTDEGKPLHCDLCGEEVASVRRVALDEDYERLATRHTVQYACERCHERKDRRRLGIDRG